MKTKAETPSEIAIRISEILIPEGIDKKGRPTTIRTLYGRKTRAGIADLILNETRLRECHALVNDLSANLDFGDYPENSDDLDMLDRVESVIGTLAR